MTALLLLVLAQPMPGTGSLNLNQQPIMVQDEGVRQGTVRAVTINCSGAGVTCTQAGSTMTLAVTGGGGGGANFSSGNATFAGKSDALTTVVAAWATAASNIICSATGEEASVEAMQVIVKSKAAGSFVVRSYVLQGTHTGALSFSCTGL